MKMGFFFTIEVAAIFSRELLYRICYSGKIYLIRANLHCSLKYEAQKQADSEMDQQVSLKKKCGHQITAAHHQSQSLKIHGFYLPLKFT
jgi:hypothetical protein